MQQEQQHCKLFENAKGEKSYATRILQREVHKTKFIQIYPTLCQNIK